MEINSLTFKKDLVMDKLLRTYIRYLPYIMAAVGTAGIAIQLLLS